MRDDKPSIRIERVATVYLTQDDVQRLIDQTPFHPSRAGYSDESLRLGLKLCSALLQLEAAPVIERVVALVDMGNHEARL